jgi:hypothetical protein
VDDVRLVCKIQPGCFQGVNPHEQSCKISACAIPYIYMYIYIEPFFIIIFGSPKYYSYICITRKAFKPIHYTILALYYIYIAMHYYHSPRSANL